MSRLKVKICGMTDLSNIEKISMLTPDYLGYIFFKKSVRYVGPKPDPAIFSVVPGDIQKVAVFVNEYYEKMIEISGKYGIEAIQLHGMESVETCNSLRIIGKTVIKVIPGDQIENKQLLQEYASVVDYFLFDTPVASYGGSGRKFDWSKIAELRSNVRFFLSGGICENDADQLKKMDFHSLYGVDINSRFESDPGIKDVSLVEKFLKNIRNE